MVPSNSKLPLEVGPQSLCNRTFWLRFVLFIVIVCLWFRSLCVVPWPDIFPAVILMFLNFNWHRFSDRDLCSIDIHVGEGRMCFFYV